MYATRVGSIDLTLRLAGLFWNRNFMMSDVQTGSEWSHLLGKCMKGKYKGRRLKALPTMMTTWGDWLRRYPKTTVLNMPRTSRTFGPEYYRDRSRFVLGLVLGGNAKAWPFDVLTRERVLLDTLAGEPLLISFDNKTTRATVYSRRLDEVSLHFYRDAKTRELKDRGTKSTWDPGTGMATAGKLKGRQLEVLPAVVAYRVAWRAFHPASGIAR